VEPNWISLGSGSFLRDSIPDILQLLIRDVTYVGQVFGRPFWLAEQMGYSVFGANEENNLAAPIAPELSQTAVRAWWESFGEAVYLAVDAAEKMENWTVKLDDEILLSLQVICQRATSVPEVVAQVFNEDGHLLRLRQVLAAIPATARLRVLGHLEECGAISGERMGNLMDEGIPHPVATQDGDPSMTEAALSARALRMSVLALHRAWLLGSVFNPSRVRLVRAAVAAARAELNAVSEAGN
jgi:hypothetical protein